MSSGTWILAIKRGDIISRGQNDKTIPLEDILVEDSSYHTNDLKKRLLKEHILANECAICDQKPTHAGKELVLQLDHINGINNDHRIENLRILCPNCHTQTVTWGRKKPK